MVVGRSIAATVADIVAEWWSPNRHSVTRLLGRLVGDLAWLRRQRGGNSISSVIS